MSNKILVVNRGSASEKYAIYEGEKCLAFLHLEKAENNAYVCNFDFGGQKKVENISEKDFKNSLTFCLKTLINNKIIINKADLAGIGIRIVAPGKHFQDDNLIDKLYEKEIKKVLHDAPLHLLPTYEMIKLLQQTLKNIPIVGISDSDFHDTIPEKAKYYALPLEITKKYNIERYGYHGISVESILRQLKKESSLPTRIIICHIGSGVSVTAVKDGQSIENTMGFTPLEGVMMATRGGNIDPGVIALLIDKLWLGPKKLKELLNKKCGLLGVSGQSSDVRDLIKLEKGGNKEAKIALDMYAYKIQQYIGAYFVALGGLDLLVFTATVGERSFIMRERICAGLEALGVKINKEINNQSEGINADISASDSVVRILVRKTDEMSQIAYDTALILNQKNV